MIMRDPRFIVTASAGVPMVSAEAYLNRYKNGWTATSMAAKQFYEDCQKRRGRPAAGAPPPIPMSEVPVPVPISRFPWPQVSFSGRFAIRMHDLYVS